jgi:hypothetical protein
VNRPHWKIGEGSQYAIDREDRSTTTFAVGLMLLQVTIPAADKGKPMTLQFRWPSDDTVFRRVATMCLKQQVKPQ